MWGSVQYIAIASGPAGPVLARPVLNVADFKTAHAQNFNNKAKISIAGAVKKPGLSEVHVRNIDYPKSRLGP